MAVFAHAQLTIEQNCLKHRVIAKILRPIGNRTRGAQI